MKAKGKIQSVATGDKLQLAFDVGHSSIGWAVLQPTGKETSRELSINILGCGAVTYRANDCLASARRAYRRQRRHIRSTRQRIARLKILLAKLGVLNESTLNKPGCAWPWLLAARVLAGGKLLTWPELWDVLRWYAHNRGYDGNRRWSAAESEAQDEDTEKEENARSLMEKHQARSMAETFCKELGLDPKGKAKASMKRFKGLNAAFPREIVEREVRAVLQKHFDKLPKVDANLERALIGKDNQDKLAWQAIPCSDLKLPKRYQGGLLFGQLVPRFDNRIISTCPISGEKVPSRNCPEFLNFRWAMQLANVQVARFGEHKLSPLKAGERVDIDKQMRAVGGMTAEQFKKAVRSTTSAIRDNLDTMLMHPDAKEALLLDPVQKTICSDELAPFWKLLPERLQKRLRGKWRHGKVFTLAQIRTQLDALGDVSAFDAELQNQLDARNTKTKKKDKQTTREELLQKHFPTKPLKLDGRAAFARHLLKKAYEEVLAGKHPKEEGNCLFLSEEIRKKQQAREIAEQTNNHLVRHRLLILERLVGDIVKEYAGGDKAQIGKAVIEVNRDLREMSGKSTQDKAKDLGLKVAHHHKVASKLEEQLENERINGKPIKITAGLIRKARIADDLGTAPNTLSWRCPYSHNIFTAIDLVKGSFDKDHIVPRSQRMTDALEALAVTSADINKQKGQQTGLQFIKLMNQPEHSATKERLKIRTVENYKSFIESLPPKSDPIKLKKATGHNRPIDDDLRRWRRKQLLLLESYEEKGFTPRDLTQTSQLVRLGAQVLRKVLPHLNQNDVVSLPGSVTGTVRKAWKALGCLQLANPQVKNEDGSIKTKTEIRNITHLHHALDACVLGLTSHFIPNSGQVWELIAKRNLNETERKQLAALNIFEFNKENRFELRDLDERLKDQLRHRLAEKRVAQHIPAELDGLPTKETVWRIYDPNDSHLTAKKIGNWLAKAKVCIPTDKDSTVLLIRRKRKSASDTDGGGKVLHDGAVWSWVYDEVEKSKVLGHGSESLKLRAIKGGKLIDDNYGIALYPDAQKGQPKFIPVRFFKVWQTLNKLPQTIGGSRPLVLRRGQLITFGAGRFAGKIWRVLGIEDNGKVRFFSPDSVRRIDKPENYERVMITSMLKDKVTPLRGPLTGILACHTTTNPKLRLDLLEHLTAEDIRQAAEESVHRFKPEPNFSKTGTGTLSSASTEERAKEVEHSMELTRKLEQRAQQSGKPSDPKP